LHPVKYEELVDMAVNARRPMEDCERIAFGVNSCEAGMWVAADWKLPAEMRRVVCAHSKSLKLGEDADSESLASVSCQFSNQLGFAAYGPPGVWNGEFAQSSLEGTVGEKAGPRLHELTEMVPYKINVFECEFFQ
jgi:HD-like signal output (HDOD) protein